MDRVDTSTESLMFIWSYPYDK